MTVYELRSWYTGEVELKIEPGMVVSMYMDDGPNGVCGQCMSITCPWQEIHIFKNENDHREWLEKVGHRRGVRPKTAFFVVGEYGTGNMRVFDHTKGTT